MRPGQNKRIRGRNGRKGPNPLTRSYESNGPDVKIRGTAQHVAEKYLQLARDAQSSGDTVMAESLLQHAEHYFRLIAAAQLQQANVFSGRGGAEAEVDYGDDDDDFSGMPDRFAPLAERLPTAAAPPFQAQPQPPHQPYQAQPQPVAHFAAPQAQPQPYEERPYVDPRQDRGERPPRPDRPSFRDRNRDRNNNNNNAEGGERQNGFERHRERRFQPRSEPAPVVEDAAREASVASSLPAFITAPVRSVVSEQPEPAPAFSGEERAPGQEHEPAGYHLNPRRRRRPRPAADANAAPGGDAPHDGELPLGD